MRTIKEALEEGSLSLEDEIDYADMTEEEYKKEIERLNNIIEDLLKRQNEALKYINNFLAMNDRYKYGNGNDELELVRRILNKHNKELKGSDKE